MPRTTAAQKAQERKAKRKKQRAQSRARQGKASLREEFALFRADQREKLKALAKTVQVIWKNEQELDRAHDLVNEQFCVLTRLTITTLNDILLRISGEEAELIRYEAVNAMFQEFQAFRKRPDFKQHMDTWMMGGDLSALPPPPVVKEEGEPGAALPEEDGAKVFGGDYEEDASDLGDEGADEESPGGEEDLAAPEVPEGQDDDEAPHQPPGEEGASLP